MGITRGLLTGFTLAGIVTFAYEQNLYSSSAYLRNALVSLSKDLDSLRIQSRVDEVPKEPVSLEKPRLGDQMKMQVCGVPAEAACTYMVVNGRTR